MAGCFNPTTSDFEEKDVVYRLMVIKTEHGEITTNPGGGIPGTRINITINPDAGYVIQAGSIKIGDLISGGQNYEMADRPPYQYLVASRNVYMKAEFTKAPTGYYTVHIAPLAHGMIQAIPQYGVPGTVVNLTITPEAGYALKEGTLKSNNISVTGDVYEIRIPANGHAEISAVFEKTGAVEYIASGKKAIRNDNYDVAVELFEAAYQTDPSNPDAILYSSFGKIASHLVSPRVRPLLSKMGNFSLPSSINQMINTSTDSNVSGSWLRIYDGKKLPGVNGPSGFTSSFYNFAIDNPEVYANPDGTASMELMKLYVIFNTLNINSNTDTDGMNKLGNPNAFNNYLDDLLNYVFGDTFEDICRRVETLDPSIRIPMENTLLEKFKYFLEVFNLDTAYTGEGVFLGRVELEAILAYLRIVKASIEFLAAYNWELDSSFIKIRYPYSLVPEDLETINNVINKFLFQEEFGLEAKFKAKGFIDTGLLTTMLPFRNKFLTKRNDEMMNRAKSDYLKALSTLLVGYDYYYSTGAQIARQSKELLNDKYSWARDGAGALRQAISLGGNFTVPDKVPADGASWSAATSGAKYIVNMDKLFTPGQLTLARLISAEQNGKAARFFGFNENGAGGTPIENMNQIKQYGAFGLEINMKPLKEVFLKGFEDYSDGKEWLHSLLSGALLTPENGAKLYEYYQAW
jgi:hypothetical protein